jgi:hypothetical protein
LKNQTSSLSHQDIFKNFLTCAVALLSIKFYSLFVPYSVGKGLVLLGVVLVLIFYLLNLVYNNSKDLKKGFTTPVVLIFISLFVSSIAANYFHDQSILTTLFTQFDLYFFLFYFLLHKLKPNVSTLVEIIVYLGLIYCALYIIQFVIYPTKILTCAMRPERGTIRIFMPGIDYMVAAYYIFLSRFFITNRPKYLFIMVPIMIVLFLLGTRQAIFIVALMTIVMILFSKRVKSKFVILLFIVLSTIPIFFIFQQIFYNMFNLTVSQGADAQEYIRVKAAQYFVLNFNPNPIWIFTGNGMPGLHSGYGIAISRLTKTSGFYLNDIGLIGDFFRYGILYVLAMLYMLYQLVRIKLHEQFIFIRYNTYTSIMAIFVGAGMSSQSLVLFCMMLYITDVDKIKIAIEKLSARKQEAEDIKSISG